MNKNDCDVMFSRKSDEWSTPQDFFDKSKSLSKKKQREMCGKPYLGKPDRDNTEKVIQDALNGCLYDDDAQVYAGYYEKIYVREGEETRVEVTFTEVE